MKTNAYFDPIIKAKTKQSDGFWKAYRAWNETNNPEYGYFISEDDSEVVMNDSCWASEWHDFIETLRKAGVKTMVVTCRSTGLMEDIHAYVEQGCEMVGLCKAKKRGTWSDKEPVLGIRFKL